MSISREKKLKPPIKIDLILLAAILSLVGFGLLMVYSATGIFASQKFGDSYHFISSQLKAALVGLIALVICYKLPIKKFRDVYLYLFGIVLFLLVLTLIPGIGLRSGGAQRWVNLGFVNFQPVEPAKLLFIVFISGYFAKQQDKIKTFLHGLVLPGLSVAIVGYILLKQPDFGTTSVIAAISLILAFLAGVRKRYFLIAALFVLVAAAVLVSISPYRMNRMISFLDPMSDMKGKGYQLVQSLIAVGSGGLEGMGLGMSQQKLLFLPAAHTDFIFAVISEELGFIGAVSVIIVFLVILWRGFRIARGLIHDTFLFLLAIGTCLVLVLPAFINMGVVLGLLPTKGLVLPLLGYGGSNLISSLIAGGILLSLGKYAQYDK